MPSASASSAGDRFPFLDRLGAEGRREVDRLVPARVAARHGVLRRGDPVDGAIFVVGGSLRVFYLSEAGREATLYRVEPGGTCILALTATFRGEPYPAWVEAGARGAEYVRVPGATLRRLFDAEPAFRDFVFGVLSGRVFELMCALEEAGTALLEQRLARWLVRSAGAGGVVRATQAGIASELGTAREVVFRALRALAGRGLVRTGRACVALLDLPGLRRAAEGAEADPAAPE
jgi:CRP/FNR family transcriptional regulator